MNPHKNDLIAINYLRVVYLFNALFIISIVSWRWNDWIHFRPERMVELLGWFKHLPFPGTEILLMISAIAITVVSVRHIDVFWMRIATAIVSVIFYGRYNNFDHIDHNYYFVLYPLFIIAMIGPKFSTIDVRKACKYSLLASVLPLTLAGINKLIFGIYHLFTSNISIFQDTNAFLYLIAKEAPLLDETPYLVSLAMKYPLTGYFLFLLGIFIQILTIPWVLTGKWFTLLAFVVIMFQFSTELYMDIFFTEATMILLALILLYPKLDNLEDSV